MDRISSFRPAADLRPRPERFMSPDMAQMLDDIQRAQERDEVALTAPAAAAPAETPAPPKAEVVAGTDLPTAVATHALHHAGHEKKANGMTGAHLGLEAGEMVAKKAGMLADGAHAAAAAKAHVAVEAKVHAAAEGAHALSDVAEASSLLATGIAVGGAIGSSLIGIGMLALGGAQIREGVHKKDREQIAEGTGEVLLGVRSGAAAVALAGHSAHGVLGAVAHAAHAVLMPLGIAHGAIDTALGARKIYQGVQQKDRTKVTQGALGAGFGVALIASAVGGGIPAVVTAGVFLVGKVAHKALAGRH